MTKSEWKRVIVEVLSRTPVPETESELASLIGCERRSVNRYLAELRDEGQIDPPSVGRAIKRTKVWLDVKIADGTNKQAILEKVIWHCEHVPWIVDHFARGGEIDYVILLSCEVGGAEYGDFNRALRSIDGVTPYTHAVLR